MNTRTQLPSRIAYLNQRINATLEEYDGPWTIHGTALGADEVTNGAVDGDPQQVEWPADVLQDAAASLEGRPIIDVHSDDDDGDIQFPPPASITVGKVDRVGYDVEVGIIYEATLADQDLARKIEAGVLTVSPEVGFAADERDDGVLVATQAEFYGLAIVSVGGSDSASAAAGSHEALAQATLSAAGIDALLGDSAPDDPPAGEVADGTGTDTQTTPAEPGSDADADNDTTTQMGDNPDDPGVSELLDRLDNKDEEIATLREEKEELAEKTATLSERNDMLEEEIDAVKEGYAAVLAEDGPFDEDDLVDNFDVATLRERFEDRFEDGFAATLSEPDIQSGGGGGSDNDGLDDATLAEAQAIHEDIATLGGAAPQSLREDLVETVDADSYDEALEVINDG